MSDTDLPTREQLLDRLAKAEQLLEGDLDDEAVAEALLDRTLTVMEALSEGQPVLGVARRIARLLAAEVRRQVQRELAAAQIHTVIACTACGNSLRPRDAHPGKRCCACVDKLVATATWPSEARPT